LQLFILQTTASHTNQPNFHGNRRSNRLICIFNVVSVNVHNVILLYETRMLTILMTFWWVLTAAPHLCTTQWSSWINTDSPSTGDGDHEVNSRRQVDSNKHMFSAFCTMLLVFAFLCIYNLYAMAV